MPKKYIALLLELQKPRYDLGLYKRNMKGVPLGDSFELLETKLITGRRTPNGQAQVCSIGRG